MDVWLDFFHPFSKVHFPSYNSTFHKRPLQVNGWVTRTMLAGRISALPMDLMRGSAHVNSDAERIAALRFRDRPAFLRIGDRIRILAPGDLQILDCGTCSSITTTGGVIEAITISKSSLALPTTVLPQHQTITTRQKGGYYGAEWSNHFLPDKDCEFSPQAARRHLDSLKADFCRWITEWAADRARTADRFGRIRSFVQRNASASNFKLSDICREFHVSRATIFRAFEADGGVNAHVMRRRLNMAMIRLLKQKARRGAVTRTARAQGFEDVYHFSRLIRRTYGISPSEVLAIELPQETLDHQVLRSRGHLSVVAASDPAACRPRSECCRSEKLPRS